MKAEKARISRISTQLVDAASDVRILRNIAWSDEVEHEFFRHNAQRIPVVQYPEFDAKPILDQLKSVRKEIEQSELIRKYAGRIADKLELSVRLLQARGTKEFYKISSELYGHPKKIMHNGSSSILELAKHFDEMLTSVKSLDLGPPPETVTAEQMVERMREAAENMFGEHAPEVVLDPTLASNALAGRRRISIRPGARFTERDVEQLIQHEAYIHVATSINGALQPHLGILVEGHAGTTSTQEGLAVFAEFITGTLDLDRLRRLSDRVIAIQKAIDGADFIDIYRYYLEKTDHPGQSFQNAKRVFRGGLPTGKAPFTKDIVYLEGLTDIHNFLRLAIAKGKFDYLNLLFVGKVNLADLPTLKELSELGLVDEPRFLPHWIKDKRFLLSYLSYSSFLTQFDTKLSSPYYEKIFKKY